MITIIAVPCVQNSLESKRHKQYHYLREYTCALNDKKQPEKWNVLELK